MADGQVLIESKLESSGVRKGVKEIKQDLTGIAKAADRAADDQTAAIKSAWNKTASESASGSRKVVDDLDDIGDKAESVGGKISSGIGGAFSKLAATAAVYLGAEEILEAGLYAIETAADVRAENAQFTQTFKDLQSQATESLNVIARETGITATRMRKAYTSVFAFSKSVGVDETQALDIANRAMVVAADSAAYYDRSLEETTETLQSFLKGNYENDAALGFAATETTRNAKANELYAKSFDKLTEAQKVDVLLSMVEAANEASGALGQAALEADAWTNVTGELKEAWRQFVAVMGEPIMDYATPIVRNVTTLLQDLPGMIENFNLSDIFGDADFTPAAQSLESLKVSAENLANVLSGALRAGYDSVLQPLAEWYIEGQLVEEIQALSNSFSALSAVLAGMEPFVAPIKELFEFLQNFKFPTLATQINDLAKAFDFVKTVVGELGPGVSDAAGEAENAGSEFEGMGSAAETASQTASTAFGTLYQNSAAAFSNTRDDAVGKIGEIQTAIDGLEGTTVYVDIVPRSGGLPQGSVFGSLPGPTAAYTPTYAYEVPTQIPYLATGAVIPPNAPFMAVLGDQTSGTNVEAPLETIKQAVAEALGDDGIEVTNRVYFEGSLAQLGRVLRPVIESEAKRKGKNLSEEVAL